LGLAFAAGLAGASAEMTSTVAIGSLASWVGALSAPLASTESSEGLPETLAVGAVDSAALAIGAAEIGAAEIGAAEIGAAGIGAGATGAGMGATGAGADGGDAAGCEAADFTPRRSASRDQLDFLPESVIRLYASYLS
jgi:hypothetical protein